MRLRTFSAATVAEAMRLVREELGPDAVIIETEPSAAGCLVTAALETEADLRYGPGLENAYDPLEAIADALAAHGVPPPLAQRLADAAIDRLDDNPTAALANALRLHFRFEPIELAGAERILLVGPPGAGKTVTAAKLAARHVLMGRLLRLVSADAIRAGGVEQLAALTQLMGLPLASVEGPAQLARHMTGAPGPVIIDSHGFNPYRAAERQEIVALARAARAEPVLVLPAGMDLAETAETASSCAELGCRRLIVTRLDLTRRLGSLLAAAEAGGYAFAEVGVAPDIADGLCPLTPLGLARLLLPTAAEADAHFTESNVSDRGARQ